MIIWMDIQKLKKYKFFNNESINFKDKIYKNKALSILFPKVNNI